MPEPTVAFFKDDFRLLADATVNIRAKALHYGLGCFEGIRAYWCKDEEQLYVFRGPEHYVRLHQSCRILGMRLDHDVEKLMTLTTELLRRNEHREDTYVRPIVFNNSPNLSPTITPDDDEFAIYTTPLKDYLDTSKGITASISSWRRVGDNMIPARAKPTAAYLNSALARQEAQNSGYDEAILLTNDGYISEGSAEHLFIVRNGMLITPTSQDDNLDGITRRTICELAPAKLNRAVEMRRVSRTELYAADEAFFCGTGAQVAPLVAVDGRKIGDGTVGPVTRELQDLYFDVVRNRAPEYSHWCTPVY